MSELTTKSIFCSLALLIFILTGCTPKVTGYLDASAPFEKFNTYFIVSPDKIPYKDEFLESLTDEMKNRGYVESSIDPDLVVNFVLASSTRTEINTNYNPYSYFQNFSDARNIHESYLIISLLSEQKKLVWQGSSLLGKPKKKQTQKSKIQEVVSHIFSTYTHKPTPAKPQN